MQLLLSIICKPVEPQCVPHKEAAVFRLSSGLGCGLSTAGYLSHRQDSYEFNYKVQSCHVESGCIASHLILTNLALPYPWGGAMLVVDIDTVPFALCCPSCPKQKEPYLIEFHGANCDHCEVSRWFWAVRRWWWTPPVCHWKK